MSHRAWALFFASLAAVIASVAPAERTSPPVVAASPGMDPVPVQQESHHVTHVARAWLPDRLSDRSIDTPLAPTRSAEPPDAPTDAATVAPVSPAVTAADPLLLLPPSRGPPELS